MSLYEATFIARQEASTKEIEGLIGQISEVLKKIGGKIIKTEHWGVRTLAYPIKKQKRGYYVFLHISSNEIAKFDQKMKAQEDLLKYFVTKVDKFVDYHTITPEKKVINNRTK